MTTEENPDFEAIEDYGLTNYYSANNIILAGAYNKIEDSTRCSILNGANNYISGKYNAHVLGDYIGYIRDNGNIDFPIQSNSFHVGCFNGLHVYGDVVAFSSSDERLKDDITLIENPLEKVLSLDAIEFNWNENQETYTGHDIGLIAQQVEKVAPELIATRQDGYKAVKYDKINALLVGAIKEQQQKIESLEERIAKLEDKINC